MPQSIDKKFNDQVSKLAEQQATNGDATIVVKDRTWMLGEKDNWSGDPFDIKNMGAGFSRTNIENSYTEAMSKPETRIRGGEVAALRLQYEILMAAERAFRLRHASSIRCEMFSGSRLKGMGSGGFKKITIDHIQSMLKAAQT